MDDAKETASSLNAAFVRRDFQQNAGKDGTEHGRACLGMTGRTMLSDSILKSARGGLFRCAAVRYSAFLYRPRGADPKNSSCFGFKVK